jgi:uncharacterized cupredoxin-like copper-binding protein
VPSRSRMRLAALLLSTVAVLGACGDDDDETTAGDDTTTTAAEEGDSVTVTGADYKFEGLPDEIDAGTKIVFENSSEKELHEFVALRIPDTETRPVAELVTLPEEETNAIFGSAEPATVLLDAPGDAETIPAVGDGTISEPGRYAVVCFIPTGADPAAYLEAAQAPSDGPPQVAGGPPHAANGMYAELKVN